jgi:CheY-like chemotaxis protein
LQLSDNHNRGEKPRMACVLIIDDDEAERSATKIALEANSFEVVAVEDGKSDINAIKDRQFDLVIVDLFMRGMDGLETT